MPSFLSSIGFSRQDKDTPDIEKGENEGIRQGLSTLHLETKQKEDKKNTNFYKQDDVFIIKSLLRLFPMWGVFIVVSIMTATGSTFFSLQYSNLNTDNDIAVQIYYLVQEFLKFAIPHLYHWICCLPNEKIKIGVGMICGVMSCIFAWQLEVYRLKEVSHLVNEDPNTSISFLWLVPQFCLLGCMEGLTKEGLLELYKSQMKEEQYLQRYREEYIEFAMGLGKLLNIVLILILKGWFGDTINDSRLDKYYVVLVCVGAANFITYCCIARFFYKEREFANDDDDLANANLQQDDSIKENRDDEQNQDLGEDDKQDDKKKKVVE
ncbi:hypothetical protein L1987_12960 [Smallanthus sonchifolius]|uniref:Uncharacterized protein n=1 Tax=Smallanthus sonchifolius TaxID=185202 RepID=A0ACB9JHH4_9ASTR|nr:hypothetical protein L1987_12960 [Smallanthus sonchifolius]